MTQSMAVRFISQSFPLKAVIHQDDHWVNTGRVSRDRSRVPEL
jgi:hypothetical protein